MLSQERLKELLHYNPETGEFVWQASRGRMGKGSVAGTSDPFGYTLIRVDNYLHKAHRLAFLYMTGAMPEAVDHDNRVTNDNRWCNLNGGTRSTNQRNAKKRKDNPSGITGVVYYRGKWVAGIQVNNCRLQLGSFDTLLDAAAARKSAELKYNFHENHGRN